MSQDDLMRLLLELRVAFDDADAVAEDMLARPRRRELGPVLHRRNYREAKRKVIEVHAEIVRRVGGDGGGRSGALSRGRALTRTDLTPPSHRRRNKPVHGPAA